MRDTRRTRLGLLALLLAGFALITVDARGQQPGERGPLDQARSVAAGVFGPVERTADSATRSVGSLFDGWGHSTADLTRIKTLQAQVSTLRTQVETGAQDRSRAGQLDKLEKITALGGLSTVPAQLIALSRPRTAAGPRPWTPAARTGWPWTRP